MISYDRCLGLYSTVIDSQDGLIDDKLSEAEVEELQNGIADLGKKAKLNTTEIQMLKMCLIAVSYYRKLADMEESAQRSLLFFKKSFDILKKLWYNDYVKLYSTLAAYSLKALYFELILF